MNKLSKKETQELILDLIYSFVLCKNIDEAIIFIEDLITKKELEILSKRLRIAKLLLEGFNYRDIQNLMHVSHGTIAKISYWLSDRGEGFRKIIKQLPKEEQPKDPLKYDVWEDFSRRYPSYFLPQLVVENIITNQKRGQRIKLKKKLETLNASLSRKREANEEISHQLKDFYKKRNK